MEGLAKMGSKRGMGEGKGIAEIVGQLFAARTYAHNCHLKTSSYSKHMALNEFYDGIVDLADSLAEAAQGVYGKLDIPVVPVTGDVTDPIGGLTKYLEDVEMAEANCSKSFLGNILQEVIALFYSTLYKMKELS